MTTLDPSAAGRVPGGVHEIVVAVIANEASRAFDLHLILGTVVGLDDVVQHDSIRGGGLRGADLDPPAVVRVDRVVDDLRSCGAGLCATDPDADASVVIDEIVEDERVERILDTDTIAARTTISCDPAIADDDVIAAALENDPRITCTPHGEAVDHVAIRIRKAESCCPRRRTDVKNRSADGSKAQPFRCFPHNRAGYGVPVHAGLYDDRVVVPGNLSRPGNGGQGRAGRRSIILVVADCTHVTDLQRRIARGLRRWWWRISPTTASRQTDRGSKTKR